jgi:hypothetical protein
MAQQLFRISGLRERGAPNPQKRNNFFTSASQAGWLENGQKHAARPQLKLIYALIGEWQAHSGNIKVTQQPAFQDRASLPRWLAIISGLSPNYMLEEWTSRATVLSLQL